MRATTVQNQSFSFIRSNETVQILIGFVLLFACAQISIPLQPVPITLQTVAVMIIGLTYATRPALLTVITYLSAAGLGLPVLSEWSFGFAKLVGPTGGYLFGFLVAVLVMTKLRPFLSAHNFLALFVNCSVGTALIFALGVGWLSRFVGFSDAIQFGFVPFILPGVVKSALLCGALSFIGQKK